MKTTQQAEAHVAVVVDEKELKNFDIVESWIQEMKDVADVLSIAGVDDKAGYEKVHETRMIVKNKRCAVENKRAELKEKYSLAPGRTIDAEAKRITALLLPIETALETKQRAIDAEKKRLAEEEAKAKAKKIQDRVVSLVGFGMMLVGDVYVLDEYRLPVMTLHTMIDEEFVNYSAMIETRFHENEEVRKQKESDEKAAQEEKDRILKEQQDQIVAQQELIAKLQANQKPDPVVELVLEKDPEPVEIVSDETLLELVIDHLDGLRDQLMAIKMSERPNKTFMTQTLKEVKKLRQSVLKQWRKS